jgi:hypothetical protein
MATVRSSYCGRLLAGFALLALPLPLAWVLEPALARVVRWGARLVVVVLAMSGLSSVRVNGYNHHCRVTASTRQRLTDTSIK